MTAMRQFARLALRPIVEGLATAVGTPLIGGAAGAATEALVERFTDHSDRLHHKLELAIKRTWTALEVALAGESFWDKCKTALARGDDKAFRQQLKLFLVAIPDDRLPLPRENFRQQCLVELRAARSQGWLDGVPKTAEQLAQDASVFARFDDPKSQLQAEMQVLTLLAEDFQKAGFANLALLLTFSDTGTPLVVVMVRYFFRRAIEEDRELFQSLAWSQSEQLSEQQRLGFASLEELVVAQSQQLTGLLGEVQATVQATHETVLDMQEELRDQGRQNKAIYDAVLNLQRKLDLPQREVRPRDSLSIRSDQERQLIKDVIARYRALPKEDRAEMPALLNAIGKLEIAAGSFEAAEKDFAAVATLVDDSKAKAEAHYNAYRAALERRAWDSALTELKEAVKLDPKRFAPFPVEKYQPQRILGAGGFGVAFLCKHKFTSGMVVVKTLLHNELERDLEQLFVEAQALQQLNHPSIIGLKDCGYTDEANSAQPYMVMDFFEGVTLEQYVKEMGSLNQRELLPLAMKMGEALLAAHQKGIFHRDFKPGNLLVRFSATGWDIRLIDFGLALKQAALRDTSKTGQTLIGTSIAGTLDYAAPEQMGRLPGVSVGPYSDIYGFGKTCCFALFGTTQPVLKHWQSIPEPLADLLGRCLGEKPDDRPVDFLVVLRCLQRLPPQMNPKPVEVVEVEEVAERTPRPAPRIERPSRPQRDAEPPPSRRDRRVTPVRTSGGGRWWMVPLVGLLLVASVVGGIVYMMFSLLNRPRPSFADPGWPTFNNPGGRTGTREKTYDFTSKDPEVGRVYLTTLTPLSKSKQAPLWTFGEAGKLGDGLNVQVNGGWHAQKGLSIGPPGARTEPMVIEYEIPKESQPCLLQMWVGFDDSSTKGEMPGVVFEVLGDEKIVWASKIIKQIGEYEECRINLTGFKKLKVQYRSLDSQDNQRWTLPVWINPYLIPIDKASVEVLTPPAKMPPPMNPEKKQYLDDLKEISFFVGGKEGKNGKWTLGRNGKLGDPEGKLLVTVDKRQYSHALGIHAAGRDSWATAIYTLDGKATAFKAVCAIDDSSWEPHYWSVLFTVVGDGKVLWSSGPVTKGKPVECLVDLQGVRTIEVRTRATGVIPTGGHSVWLDPTIYQGE